MTTNRARPLIRYFNKLSDYGHFYEKSSVNMVKLEEEYHFLSNIPESLKPYFPLVSNFKSSDTSCSYEVMKIPVQDASQFIIDNDIQAITKVLTKVEEYLRIIPSINVNELDFQKSLNKNIFEKNLLRAREFRELDTFKAMNEICEDFGHKSVLDFCMKMNQALNESFKSKGPQTLHFSHGDLCFSNILLNGNNIFFIDPRGYSGKIENTFRPIYYDLAKISQSLLGRYDFINHELFRINGNVLLFPENSHPDIQCLDAFKEICKMFSIDLKVVRLIEASLFLSLIPHHRESQKKMKGFLINSLTIFDENC